MFIGKGFASEIWNTFDKIKECNKNCIKKCTYSKRHKSMKNLNGFCEYTIKTIPIITSKEKVLYYNNYDFDYLCDSIELGKINLNNNDYNYKDLSYNGKIIYYKNIEVFSNEFYKIIKNDEKFKWEYNKKYFDNEPVEYIIKKLESRECKLKDYPGLNKRLGSWCYYLRDVITDETIILNNNFQERNGVKYFQNKPILEIINNIENGSINIESLKGWKYINGRYLYYNVDILTSEIILLNTNFYFKDGIKYYRNEKVKDIIFKLKNNVYDINDFPGWNIRYDHYCYYNKDILTDETINFDNSNFVEYDGEIYININGNRILKSEYFKNFDDKIKNKSISNKIINNLINIEKFEIIPILSKTDDPDEWNRNFTNQYLVDRGYTYICYIKLFKDSPWIVGKTATTLVSKSPIDFDFIIGDKDDKKRYGPGRTFIRENYPNIKYSDHEYVLCRTFSTEQEALNFEKYIANKYNLFQS